MVNFCAIVGCSNKSTKDTSITLYRFPQISKHAKSAEQELQKKRRALWIERIKRDDVKEGNINYFRICANHFLKGRPADLLDEDNPDWAPCINLGYKTVYDKEKKRNNDATPHESDVENHEDDGNNDTAEEEEHVDNNSVHEVNNSGDDDDSVNMHVKEEETHDVKSVRSIDKDVIDERNSSDDDSVQCHEKNKKSHSDLKSRYDDHDDKRRKDDDNSSVGGSSKHSDSDVKNFHHSQNYIDLGNNLVGRSVGNITKEKSPSKTHEKVVKKHRNDSSSSENDSTKHKDTEVKRHHHGDNYIDLGNNLIGRSVGTKDNSSSKNHDKVVKKHRNDSSSSENDSTKHKDSEVKHHHHGNSYIDLGNNMIGRSINTSKRDTIVVNDESPKRHDRGLKNNRVHDVRDVENNLKNLRFGDDKDDDDPTMKDDSKNKRRQQVVKKAVKAVKTNPLPVAKRQFLNAQSLIQKGMAAGAVSPERSPQRKPLDVNKYATKKTIAQGMLDIALLTANASQLKYILQVGEKHEFYSLMLALISISIILQVTQAIIGAVLGTALNINKTEDQDNANKINNAVLGINVVVVAINIIISAFDIKSGDNINNSTEIAADAFFRNGTFYDLNNSNYITSYNQLSDIDNWSVSNVSNPDMDNSRLYQDFVEVFNKIRKIYLSNQTAALDSSFVLTNDNVNDFMDRVFEKN